MSGLVCSKLNHFIKKLELGSLKLDDFRNEGVIKSFKNQGVTVKEHFDRIMKKDIDAPMFNNTFHLLAYIPKTENAKENAES